MAAHSHGATDRKYTSTPHQVAHGHEAEHGSQTQEHASYRMYEDRQVDPQTSARVDGRRRRGQMGRGTGSHWVMGTQLEGVWVTQASNLKDA